jgi:hypothetical protein
MRFPALSAIIDLTPNSFQIYSFFKGSYLLHPLTALRKRISVACDMLSSLPVIVHASLPYSKIGTAIRDQILASRLVLDFPFSVVQSVPQTA